MKFFGWEPSSELCVVTGFTPVEDWLNLGQVSVPTMMSYCLRWGFGLRVYVGGFDESRDAPWSKLLFVRDALAKYKWVWWLDADAAVTNGKIDARKFTESNADLLVCRDVPDCVLNTGSFFIRKSDFSFWLIEELWKHEEWAKKVFWEQSALVKLHKEGKLGDRMKLYPTRTFNGFLDWRGSNAGCRKEDNLQWHVGDLVAHCSGYTKMSQRIDVLKEAVSLSHDFCRQ